MPVRKFRDVSEMNGTRWFESNDPALFLAINHTWRLAERICPKHFPPGVYRHRTIEEAQALREKWAAQQFEEYKNRSLTASKDKQSS